MSIFGDIKKGRIPGTKKKVPGVKQASQAADIPKKVAHEVEKQVPDAVKKELLKTLQSALRQFFALLFSPLNRKAVNLVKHTQPDTVWLTIGIVTFTISDLEGKADKLEYWLNHAPTDKNQLRRMLKDLEPADIEIALKGNIPGLSVGVGATLIYLPENFEDKLDAIWAEIRDLVK